jgi:uncharacterized protein YkwD
MNPNKIIENLQQMVTLIDPITKIYSKPPHLPVQLLEGRSAVLEAIDQLLHARNQQPLLEDQGLKLCAQNHANDLGVHGGLTHAGKNGQTFHERMAR